MNYVIARIRDSGNGGLHKSSMVPCGGWNEKMANACEMSLIVILSVSGCGYNSRETKKW